MAVTLFFGCSKLTIEPGFPAAFRAANRSTLNTAIFRYQILVETSSTDFDASATTSSSLRQLFSSVSAGLMIKPPVELGIKL